MSERIQPPPDRDHEVPESSPASKPQSPRFARRPPRLRLASVLGAVGIAGAITVAIFVSSRYAYNHSGAHPHSGHPHSIERQPSPAPVQRDVPQRSQPLEASTPPAPRVHPVEQASRALVRDAERPPVTFELPAKHIINLQRSSALKVNLTPSSKYEVSTAGQYLLDARHTAPAPATRFISGAAGRNRFDLTAAPNKLDISSASTGRVFALVEGAQDGEVQVQVLGPEPIPVHDASNLYVFVLTDRSRSLHQGTLSVVLSPAPSAPGMSSRQTFHAVENGVYIGDDDYAIQELDPTKVYDVIVTAPSTDRPTPAVVLCALRAPQAADARVVGATGIGGQQYVLTPDVRYHITNATEAKFAEVGLEARSAGALRIEVIESKQTKASLLDSSGAGGK